MSDDNNVDMDNLDEFEKVFFDKATPSGMKDDKPETDTPSEDEEEVPENEDDHSQPSDDEEDEAEDEDESEDEESEEEAEPEPKPKKNSAKERIEQLVKQTREAERREAALLARLERLEAAKTEDEPAPKRNVRDFLLEQGPSPDATTEDGEPLYPLGEFDPKFIRDLTRFTIKQETEAAQKQTAEQENARMIEAAQEEIKTVWADRVAKAEETLPDLREKLADMGETFAYVDPNYGEYLAATIMSCEAGPEIMYYLSQNIGEAQKIVASGPAAATLAIGRLEAKLGKETSSEPKRNKNVSKAPLPPPTRTRGSGTKTEVRGDTDDLDAFEKIFFAKKGR